MKVLWRQKGWDPLLLSSCSFDIRRVSLFSSELVGAVYMNAHKTRARILPKRETAVAGWRARTQDRVPHIQPEQNHYVSEFCDFYLLHVFTWHRRTNKVRNKMCYVWKMTVLRQGLRLGYEPRLHCKLMTASIELLRVRKQNKYLATHYTQYWIQ